MFAESQQIIEDVLQSNLYVVFCGTALGNASAESKAYYAHPRNLFWQVLHETGITGRSSPTPFVPYGDQSFMR